MQDFENYKLKFNQFLDKIKSNERVAILSHDNCIDGMVSAVFLLEILKKRFPDMPQPFVKFINYKIGVLDNCHEILNREKISKVFILDANVDMNQPEETERLFAHFDVLMIDHHPKNPNLKISDMMIKSPSNDCVSLILYNLGEEYLNKHEWTELACIAAISEFSFKSEENLSFIQKHYSFDPEDYQDADIFQKVLKFNSLVTYYNKDSKKAYEIILNRDYKEIEHANKEVSAEYQRCMEDFEVNAERHFNGKLCFYLFNSKFSIGSRLSTALSVKYPHGTIILLSNIEGEDRMKLSGRNNSKRLDYPLNEMVRAGVAGLENALGGGHDRAVGGSFLKKDLDKFKSQIIEYVGSKLNN